MSKRTVENKTSIKNSVGRIIVFGLFVIAQIVGFIVLVYFLGSYFPPLDILMRALALIVALGVNSRDHNGVFDCSDCEAVWRGTSFRCRGHLNR